eukprot:TRINITY_DN8153_c1_g4_i1.p1 TRINITY_DN8153_c1_g4~~TRINITY_DN8153_c1_g4_i1.p1  ORF type:complete len:169 (+),score=17.63 TRINITY_DN8153_c1_g4_i1:80-586(+)
MALSAAMELAEPSRAWAGSTPKLQPARLPEGDEHSESSKSDSDSDSSARLTRELLIPKPGADVNAIVNAFFADTRRSGQHPAATSRTADVLAPLRPGAPTGSQPQTAAITGATLRPGASSGGHSQSPAGTGLTGVQQLQLDASSSSARPAAMESGRAVKARGKLLISL